MSGRTLDSVRQEASREAARRQVHIAIGLHTDEATGAQRYGYGLVCPMVASGPFIHTVLERAEPSGRITKFQGA